MRKQDLHPRTAVINKAQKNSSKKARSDALLWLATAFPAAFDNSVRIRPLKSGIMNDILQHAEKAAEQNISKSKLREAVVVFTRRLDYLACLKSREMRIDLEGNEVGVVTEEEAEHASAKIKKRIEKSVKNARKMLSEKTGSPASPSGIKSSYISKSKNSTSYAGDDDFFPIYPTRQSIQPPAAKPTPAVLVKHKTTRQFDPNAVARLKEKLGLSKTAEEKKEAVD
jgi:ProP effector